MNANGLAASIDSAPRRKFYGRRQGRRLRPSRRQLLLDLLPRLAVALPESGALDPAYLFPEKPRAVWLEIGFGGGEHLVWQARQNPDIGFIGAEVFVNGVASALAHIEKNDLGNVRLFPEDVLDLVVKLQPGSIAYVFLLFPDPWPKNRHASRRFVNRTNLDFLAAIMADGAELRFASDDPTYISWALAEILDHPDFRWLAKRAADWRMRPADWPATRYEEKAIAAGRQPCYFRFRRRVRAGIDL